MTLSIKDSLLQARIDLLIDHPFYGSLALHLPLVEMPKGMIAALKAMDMEPTFCTDYKKIYYSPEFAEKCSREDKRFIVAHEILHVGFLHNIRKSERESKRWNFATDFAINSILKKEFHFIPEGGLYEEKFENMTAEEIYNKLPEMNGDKQKGGYRRYEKGDILIEIDKDGNIKVNGKAVKPFDTHMDVKGSKQELDELEKEIQIQVSKAIQTAKMAGKMPAGMEILIEELLEPKLDWRNMLRQFMIETAKSDFRWERPNRRHIHDDLYMPSLTGESLGDVAVIMDVSGSTMNAQQQFLSECNGLLQQYEMTLNLLFCDVDVTQHDIYEHGDVIKKKYTGGGGTDIPEGLKYLDSKNLNPNVVVVLTDGYTPWPDKEKFPTLWIITKDGVDLKDVPFNMKVKMND